MLDADDSRDALAWAATAGQRMEPVTGEGMYGQFSFLAPGFRQGLWMPAMANIRNPRLIRALRAWLAASPLVSLREGVAVAALRCEGAHCAGIMLEGGEQLSADAVVVAGGAWTAGLLAALGQALPVRPIQGQMIIYKAAPGALPCMVMAAGRYLIPRRDGHVLCGSTLEDVGFDKHITAAALASLRASAEALWPGLRGLEPVAHWAGLRPASPNGIPFIGRVSGLDNLWVNAGQFRNGLVLAPASARLLADLMLGRAPALDPAPYRLHA
jgi:glycine oxidase